MEQPEASAKRTFSVKAYWKEILAVLILLFAVYFFRNQEEEIKSILPTLLHADSAWTIPGLLATAVFLLLQAWMYVTSFQSVGLKINLMDGLELFLKRNLLSVFLPMGAFASLAYTPYGLKKKNLMSSKGLQASLLFGYVAILTVFLIGVPVIAYTLLKKQNYGNSWISLVILGVMLGLIVWLIVSFAKKGVVRRWMERISPSFSQTLEGFFSGGINKKALYETIFVSMLIEVVSIAMVYFSVKALHLEASLEIAAVGYILSILPMMVSPFLRGLGAVEFTLAFFLAKTGIPEAMALGSTLIYRAFQFWLPMVMGLVAYLWNGRNLIGRILPAAGIFLLGLVNILSVVDVPITGSLSWETHYFSIGSVHASKAMFLFLGIVMMLVSANLANGHRNAYRLALALILLSVLGQALGSIHIGVLIFAFILLVLLIVYRKEYRLHSDPKWVNLGFMTFLVAFVAVCLFDCIGFYLLDKRHFGQEFTWIESMNYTLKSFFLLSYDDLIPLSRFAKDFLLIVHLLSLGVWTFLVVTLLTTQKVRIKNTQGVHLEAKQIVEKHGSSAFDHFKYSKDRTLFLDAKKECLVSYKIARDFAVVLEGPVCTGDRKASVLKNFEEYCLHHGLKTCYFLVGEEDLPLYRALGKKRLWLGHEIVLNLKDYNRSKVKELFPNADSWKQKGGTVSLLEPPHRRDLLHTLREISDEWLESTGQKKRAFASGVFDPHELKEEKLLVASDASGNPVAFLDIIAGITPGVCTFALLRTGVRAEDSCIEALYAALTEYALQKGYRFLSLGMHCPAEITDSELMPEQMESRARERILKLIPPRYLGQIILQPSISRINRYLVYDISYDFLKIPSALAKVSRPPLKIHLPG